MNRRIMILAMGLILALATGCKEDSEAPSDHTISKNGSMHKPGLYDPENECTGCHGASLRGGGEAPSCYSCHSQKW